MEIRVYYEDTDCGGVAYYANYLRWLERGRTEFMRARGIELAAWMQRGFLFSVAECSLKYRRPAKYDDLLDVSTEVEEVGGAAFWLKNEVRRGAGREGLLLEARVRMACMGPDGRARRIPAEIAGALCLARDQAQEQDQAQNQASGRGPDQASDLGGA
jgi:acyl-CoA thioester hydrolase